MTFRHEMKNRQYKPKGLDISPVKWRLSIPALLIGASLLLGGCAAQQAYRQGVSASEAGDPQAALRHFEEAARLDSGSALFRMATMHARESLALQHRKVFDQLLAQGKIDEAATFFRENLLLSTDSSVLRARLSAAQATSRHSALIAQAQELSDKGATDEARQVTRKVLSENPQHPAANNLLTRLDATQNAQTRPSSLDKAFKKPISIEFKDTQLKTIFEVFSRTSGVNFVFDKDVRTDQKTSIYLRNSTVEAALALTLLTNQLSQRVLDGNSVLIFPSNQAKLKDYQSLSVKVFYLAHAEAKGVAASIKTLLKTKDMVVDDKLNMIIMRDSPEAIRMAEKLVRVHDVADPEVMLEVEILEVNRSRLLNLGVRWPDQISLNPIAADGTNLTLADLWAATKDRRGRTIGASVGSTTIQAGKTDSDGDILANPRIRVRNRDKARILIGDRVPNITSTSTSTGFVAESVNYVDVGLKLEVEPVISIDGEVTIKVSLEVSNIVEQITTKAGSVAYRIGTRTAQTVLQLRDGENQVLAGLINNEERSSGNKIPGLGDLPLAGRLFGSQTDNTNRTEIVLSITPRILRNITRPDAEAMEFDSGTDAVIGMSSLSSFSLKMSNALANAETATDTSNPRGSGQRDRNAARSSADPTASALTSDNRQAGPAQANSENSGANPAPQGVKPEPPKPASYLLSWVGPSEVSAGDNFTVQLALQADAPLVSIPLSLGFAPEALQVVSVKEGNLLRQSGANASFVHRVDPSGQILMTATRSGNSTSTEEPASGTFASITFRALQSSTTQTALRILAIAPVGAGGRSLNAPLPAPHAITIRP